MMQCQCDNTNNNDNNIKKCIVCFGFIHKINQIQNDCFEFIKNSDYDLENVSITIQMPSSVHVTEQFFNQSKRRLKDQLKDSLINFIADNGIPIVESNQSTDLNILAVVTNAAADEIVCNLYSETVSKKLDKNGNKRARTANPVKSSLTMGECDELVKCLDKSDVDELKKSLEELTCEPKYHFELSRSSIYFIGSYVKLARYLSHSPWFINNERKGDTSVEELICLPLKALCQASSYNFHSAGREDFDVRMLGDGRPFVVEVVDAKKIPDLKALEHFQDDTINQEPSGMIRIRNLEYRAHSRDCMSVIIDGEDSKRKQYSAVVWIANTISESELKEKIDCIQNMEISQNTPVRVLHRRSALVRTKMIYSCACEYLNPHFFILRLETSAGTYIKEFVHGDFGRTEPSVGSILGTEADIIQLDVEKIIMD